MRAEVAQFVLNIINGTPIQATVAQVKEGVNPLLDEAITDLTALATVESVGEEATEETADENKKD